MFKSSKFIPNLAVVFSKFVLNLAVTLSKFIPNLAVSFGLFFIFARKKYDKTCNQEIHFGRLQA